MEWVALSAGRCGSECVEYSLEDKKIVISLGACIYDGKEELSFDDLYYRADSAMYQSKKKDGCSATIFRK